MNGAKRRASNRRGDPAKAVGVVRVSTAQQDIGADAQRDELSRWAIREGVELIAIFEDIGVSGAAPMAERPALIAAIAVLAREGAGKLVAVKRDRFARHRHTIADVERAVLVAGGVLVTTDGVCTGADTESEEVNASIQDLVAALELRKIRARNQARARRCIEQGRLHGGKPPYGLRRKPKGIAGRSGTVVELEPDPSEQEVIARIVHHHRQGSSLRQISTALDSEGIVTRTGAKWQAMTIARVLARAVP
jgi:DNA invertase Pin-like site-specific DNA recombinase